MSASPSFQPVNAFATKEQHKGVVSIYRCKLRGWEAVLSLDFQHSPSSVTAYFVRRFDVQTAFSVRDSPDFGTNKPVCTESCSYASDYSLHELDCMVGICILPDVQLEVASFGKLELLADKNFEMQHRDNISLYVQI